ncbi:hypothetical protein [Solimonas soli]|uniref:hypothetical protein n=1 Tax=Solimonas soli TaxID=413479 RepID=UPI0004822CD1|nr:hypothetical protein [Solimonas soli]
MTNGWKIGAIAVVVGVGTYVGLKLLLPHHKVEVLMEGLVPADSVFGDKLKSPTEVAAAAQTPGAADAGAAATTPSGPAVNTDDATAAPAAAPAETAAADSAAEAPPPPPAEPAPAAAAAEPAAPAAASEPPAPQAKPAARPAAPKPPRGDSGKAPKAASAASGEAQAAASSPWWQTAGGDGLHIVYVGSAAYKRAIVVMGSAPFADAAAAGKNIQVVDRVGKRVGGAWEINRNNPTMLVLPVDANGRYQLTIGAALADAKGHELGQSLKGAVLVE